MRSKTYYPSFVISTHAKIQCLSVYLLDSRLRGYAERWSLRGLRGNSPVADIGPVQTEVVAQC
jgi:hypothetical protein